MKSNRVIRNIAGKTVFAGLWAAAFCLAGALTAQAQSYTKNYIYTVAGGGPVPTAPLSLDLPGPTAAIKDASGNIYFAAQDSAYVYELSTTGTLSVFAGLGYGGYSGDGKKATAALIGGVTGLAIDSKGNIYLADAAGSRIRKVTPAGIISTVAGSGTKCDKAGICGDGGAALKADLNLPESVALDSAGNIYIADMSDNRIRVVNVGTTSITIAGVTILPEHIQTVAGNSLPCANSQGTPPTCGDGGPANKANLTMPYGVAVDSTGNIYIADTKDQEIRIVAAGQSDIATFAGNGTSCYNQHLGCGDGGPPASAQLWSPKGVFTDAAGDVYIADTSSNRIRYVAKGSNVITTLVDNTGGLGFSGDNGVATAAQTDGPVGIFADASGNLLVADTGNQRIRSVTAGTTPTITTIAGGSMGGDGGPPLSATLANPWDVAEDGSGNLYIVDQGNNRIRKITNPGQGSAVITTVAGNGDAGYTGDGGLATSAMLNAPSGIAIGSNNVLFIADSNNLVIRAVNLGTSSITLGTVTIAPGDIATVFGNGQSCNPTTASCGDDGPALGASFAFPLFIGLDPSNNVFVSDYQAARIREWNVSENFVTNPAGTGAAGYKGVGGLGNEARINHPGGLGIYNGTLYFADQWDDIVQSVVLSTDILSNYCLDTLAKFTGDGGPCLKASMFNPLALRVSSIGDVYISGGNDNLVQRASAATGIFSTVAGAPTRSYQAAFSGDGGPALNARMANLGALVDGNDNLYVADGGNNRIRYVPLAPAVSLGATTLSTGQWPIGVAGNPVPLTVTGAGGADLSWGTPSFSGANSADFSQTNNCPTLLSPQAYCTVEVTLTPSQYGAETATLNINDNATGSPQTVTLTGFGPDFTISDSPNTMTVVHGSAGTSTVTLTPQAKFAQAIGLSCPTGLPAGATCSFNPSSVQLYGGSAQASTLTIQTSASTPAGTYTVTTTGVFSPLSHSATITLTVQ